MKHCAPIHAIVINFQKGFLLFFRRIRLKLVYTEEHSGTIRTLPIKWADVRREAKTLSEQQGTIHSAANRFKC